MVLEITLDILSVTILSFFTFLNQFTISAMRIVQCAYSMQVGIQGGKGAVPPPLELRAITLLKSETEE